MSRLLLVPTPIGDLDDITIKSIKTLNSVNCILCEDTRHSYKLLQHHNIETPRQPFHQHNEHKVIQSIIERLKSGETMALISDAGTPGISDPGYLLVRECIEHDIPVEVLPGATSIIPAVVGSGLPSDQFAYLGFPPQKKGRQTFWKQLENETKTMVILESPHRVAKAVNEALETFGEDRKGVIVRELTKIHETYHRGTLQELNELAQGGLKGEIVLVIEGLSHYEKRMKK